MCNDKVVNVHGISKALNSKVVLQPLSTHTAAIVLFKSSDCRAASYTIW